LYTAEILVRLVCLGKPIRVGAATCADVAALSDALTELIAYWYKNGQITLSPSPFARSEGSLRAFVQIPTRDALEDHHNNVYARASLQALAQLSGAPAIINMLGHDPESLDACCCERNCGFILFTYFISTEAPVRCAKCFKPVPLYQLPHTRDHEHLDKISWAHDYRACDRLQMNCTVGERYHERQLIQVTSQLSQSGLKVRAALEASVGAPVYYFLFKSRGVSLKRELLRRCPSCAGEWHLASRWHRFDFRCEPCRLVSAVASTLGV
jgi:predicted  nucleic acid-binding Zn ribbon protein